MKEIILTNENFEQEVLRSDVPVLVDFWATWCGPCRMFAPILSKLAENHPEIKVGKVNVDEEQALAMRYQVMSIPTLLLFKDGQVADQSVGLRDYGSLERMIG